MENQPPVSPCFLPMPHSTVRYVEGDATLPLGSGPKILVHVCNDAGKWGRGFVKALSRRWPGPESFYRACFSEKIFCALGDVQFVPVDALTDVANLIGQHGIAARGKPPPVRYDAIRAGLVKVAIHAQTLGATVHMPRIGCGLAGGEWAMIIPIIESTLVQSGIHVTVYDFDAE
jgi:hypothetical protein